MRGQDRLRPVLSHLTPRLDLTKVGGVPSLRYDMVVPDTRPLTAPNGRGRSASSRRRIETKIKRHAIVDIILLLAIGAMSTARYW